MADKKLAKFGEGLKANTERSRFPAERVETRRQVKLKCIRCSKRLSGRQQKYCSELCLVLYRRKTKVARKYCKQCKCEIHDRYANAIYCSVRCRQQFGSYKWRVLHGLIKNPGVGSGNAQLSGELHHTYKNGRLHFRDRAFAHYPKKCCVCSSKRSLDVHHIDMDISQQNNNISNLRILRRSCHKKVHYGSLTLKV